METEIFRFFNNFVSFNPDNPAEIQHVTGEFGISPLFQVRTIQPFHKEQTGDSIDDRERNANTAAPEFVLK